MAMVEVENLSKTYQVADKQPGLMGTLRHFLHRRYKAVEAVKNVTFSIEPGEIVGFLGPNGAGKTTTLKMLTGLVYPTVGRVSVAGHTPFDRRAEFLHQITLVMGQKQQLIWDLPAMDSLRINAAVYNVPAPVARKRIDELADMLSLDEELYRPVRKLSLGERMKCELIAALLHQPRILFLDEPTLGLDVNAQTAVRSFLRQYNVQHQAAILLTSHYMADITALCQRVVLIHEGQLMYDGSLDGIVQRFAPFREVKIDLADEVDRQALAGFGEIESLDGNVASLLVKRDELTRVVARILDQLQVRDLTVTDPPVEQVIGRIFDHGIDQARQLAVESDDESQPQEQSPGMPRRTDEGAQVK